jgi:hypothetical protein
MFLERFAHPMAKFELGTPWAKMPDLLLTGWIRRLVRALPA